MSRRDEELTAETVVETPRAVRPPPRDIADQTRLGHFHLLEPLGHGGMGTVFSAYDLHLDRKVAIKLLSDRDLSPEQDLQRQQRLLREAQAMAKLSHPNVVPVYEVGVEDDTVFIAMEYVEGTTLGEWLKERERTWREIVAVFMHAARGLAAAHEAGIVHRDFKPSNVLVDVDGRVRVVDFGIAKVWEEGEGEASNPTQPTPRFDLGDGDDLTPLTPSTPLTELGSLIGTPAYMSPEQYLSVEVDARSDQFSFCVALYDALYGTRPFRGRGETLAANVKGGRFEKPSSKTVPGWVTAAVLRGLAAAPDDRFPSMIELADALGRDPRRLHWRLALGGAVTAAIAAAVLIGWQLNARQDATCSGAESHIAEAWDVDRRVAIENSFKASGVAYAVPSFARVAIILDGYRRDWVAMRTEACKATHVRREQSERVLDLRMACLDQRRGELRALTTLLAGPVDAEVVEHAVEAATELTSLVGCADTASLLQPGVEPSDPAMRARRTELLETLGHLNTLRHLGQGRKALEPVRALVADARAANDNHVIARALEVQGALEMLTGDLSAAEVTLAEAIRRSLQLGDVDLLVKSTIDLISTLAEGGISKSREALGVIRFVEAIVEDANDPALAIHLAMEKGNEFLVVARPDLALPILEETLERGRQVLGEDHVQVFQLQSLYASALTHLRKYDEASEQRKLLIASTTRVLGELHPVTLNARVAGCRVLADGGSPSEGVTCFASVMPDAIKIIGGDDRHLLSMRAYHGTMLVSLKRLEEARRVYVAAMADVPEAAWKEKWFIATDMARALGWIEVDLGNFASGLAHCEQALAATDSRHAGTSGATCVAEAHLGLGNPESALEVLEPLAVKVANTKPAHLGASNTQVAMWRFAYARALWGARRDAAQARVMARLARNDLGDDGRAQLDKWLSTLPR